MRNKLNITKNKSNDNNSKIGLPKVPKSIDEALSDPVYGEIWFKSIFGELDQLSERKTFKKAGHSGPGAKSRLVFDVTLDSNMELKFKTRFVLCGYSQIKGVNYDQTFAPTVTRGSVMIVIYIGLKRGFVFEIIDIGNAFLEGENDYEIYMYLPDELVKYMDESITDGHSRVRLQVLRSLYGEKQAAYIWNERFNEIMKDIGFDRSINDPCIYFYINAENNIDIYVTVHVDDMLVVANNKDSIEWLKQMLKQYVSKIKNFPNIKKYVGMQIEIKDTTILLSQKDYAEQIVREFYINNNNETTNIPMNPTIKLINNRTDEGLPSLLPLIGKLRYLADCTRPDLLASLGMLSSGGINPTKEHIIASKKYLQYLNNNTDISLKVDADNNRNGNIVMFCFSDASYVTTDDSKSRLGGCLYLGYNTSAFHSFSTKDNTVSHSSTEAEIKAIDKCIILIIFYRELLAELGYRQELPTIIYVDNLAAKELSETLKTNHKVKHINMRLNFIRECINNRIIELHFIPSYFNVADILTKPLANDAYHRHQSHLCNGIPVDYISEINRNIKLQIHNRSHENNNNTYQYTE